MDGTVQNLPLPPSPGQSSFIPPTAQQFAQPPPAPGSQQPAQRQPAAVGRPSGDPEIQEARAEKHALRQRLRNILPKSMTDGRIAIYKLEGRKGRNRTSPKPVMTILFQDLEKAQQDGTYQDTGEMVEDRLREKYGDRGRFLWEAQDNRGKTIPEAGETEIDLSNENNDEDDDMDGDENDLGPEADDEIRRPSFFDRPSDRIAPPPPAFDPAIHARQVKEIVQEEKKGAQDTLALMMTMMQQQTQMQLAQMEQARREAEERRREEDRRRQEERERERERQTREEERMREDRRAREKEEDQRRERERESRTQMLQLALPLITKFMEPKPDVTTPMLMKMIESKGDREGIKDLFSLMGEASRQSMVAQGEATKHLLASQAEAAKTMMANVMGISQSMIQNMVESQAEPTDDPMEKVARVFKMIAPALGALNSNAQQTVIPQQPPQRLPQQQGQPQQQQQRVIPPTEYIKGGLYTIMRLETGEIPVQKRFEALRWCSENLPKPMLDAIRSGSEEDVLAQGAPGMDDRLFGWIQDDQHMDFLRDCVKDIQRLLLGAMTQADAKASFEKHVAYMQAKGQPQPAQAEVIPAEVAESQVAQPAPVEEKANGKRRAPPPSDEPKDVEQVSEEAKQ
jgi:hypothetical protein